MTQPDFDVVVSCDGSPEALAAQRLRYEVFVKELGGDGAMVDHEAGLERDRFDPFCKHLLLLDRSKSADMAEQVVGAYRVLDSGGAALAGQFYSEDEYDIEVLKRSGKRLLELGRSCLHRDYRGGAAMYVVWSALSRYVMELKSDILFGTASFHGIDADDLAMPLSLLHHRHLAPEELRVTARAPSVALDRIAEGDLDRRAAMLKVPALIKAYLRLGGFVGQGAYLDHRFNTTDVCLILDLARMNDKQRNLYAQERRV